MFLKNFITSLSRFSVLASSRWERKHLKELFDEITLGTLVVGAIFHSRIPSSVFHQIPEAIPSGLLFDGNIEDRSCNSTNRD
jgi:hypothetical protein